MEEKKQEQHPQYFYFNDDGKLVVESNKGVWVDGEQYVKMYGNFICNAKTMGVIISQLKGMPAFVSIERSTTNNYFGLTECLINPSAEQVGLLSEISHKDGEIEKLHDEIKKLNDEIKKLNNLLDYAYDQRDTEHKEIERFNALPWYKRIFKKIEIKTN